MFSFGGVVGEFLISKMKKERKKKERREEGEREKKVYMCLETCPHPGDFFTGKNQMV